MALTQSGSLIQGSRASPFCLPDTRNGETISLEQFHGKPVLVAFICNHCPYVVHLLDSLVLTANALAAKGIATVAISANDTRAYPADSPENMRTLAMDRGFEFPYCHDESQKVAKAYGATCTPDLFLFDAQHQLYYHGQYDASRPGNGVATGEDLKQAVSHLLDHEPPPLDAQPSVGCSIKWKN